MDDIRYVFMYDKCTAKLCTLVESQFYETMTRDALVQSMLNFGFYFKDNLNEFKMNDYEMALEKIQSIIRNLSKYLEHLNTIKRKISEKLMINTLDIIHVSLLYQ